jgi:hypothetical protein
MNLEDEEAESSDEEKYFQTMGIDPREEKVREENRKKEADKIQQDIDRKR